MTKTLVNNRLIKTLIFFAYNVQHIKRTHVKMTMLKKPSFLFSYRQDFAPVAECGKDIAVGFVLRDITHVIYFLL